MRRFGRANKPVVADVERGPQVAECASHALDVLGCRSAGAGGDAFDVDAVLVSASQQEDVVALLAAIASDCISGNRRVGVSNVRQVVGVIDGCREVVGGHVSSPRSSGDENWGNKKPHTRWGGSSATWERA